MRVDQEECGSEGVGCVRWSSVAVRLRILLMTSLRGDTKLIDNMAVSKKKEKRNCILVSCLILLLLAIRVPQEWIVLN